MQVQPISSFVAAHATLTASRSSFAGAPTQSDAADRQAVVEALTDVQKTPAKETAPGKTAVIDEFRETHRNAPHRGRFQSESLTELADLRQRDMRQAVRELRQRLTSIAAKEQRDPATRSRGIGLEVRQSVLEYFKHLQGGSVSNNPVSPDSLDAVGPAIRNSEHAFTA